MENVLRCRLLDLEKMGYLESFEDQTEVDESSGRRSFKRWRRKTAGNSIESLVADANARGVEVVVVDVESSPHANTGRQG